MSSFKSVIRSMPGSFEARITRPASSIAAMEACRHGRHERRDVLNTPVNATCSMRQGSTTVRRKGGRRQDTRFFHRQNRTHCACSFLLPLASGRGRNLG